jgi:hypothetical protein
LIDSKRISWVVHVTHIKGIKIAERLLKEVKMGATYSPYKLNSVA